MIEVTFFINGRLIVLFDSIVFYSFIAQDLVSTIGLAPEVLRRPLEIVSPIGHSVVLYWTYRWVRVNLDDRESEADLVILPIRDFDMILGMNWLFSYKVQIDCFPKMVNFKLPGQ